MAVKASNQISITDITDAYSVVLTSETYTFIGNTSGAPSGLSCTTQAVAYCGAQQCSSIRISSVACPSGITASIANNNTASPTITFKTTSTITTSCEATISIAVDGIVINKKFSFSVAKQGNTGSTGATGNGIKSTSITYQAGASGTTAPTGTWSSTPPKTSISSPYLWTRTIITYTDGTSSISYNIGSTADGIEVGGRNLLRNTGSNVLTYSCDVSNDYNDYSTWIMTMPAEAKQYTLSFWAKADNNDTPVTSYFYNPNTVTHTISSQGFERDYAIDGYCPFTLSTEWKKYWVTYTQNKTNSQKTVIFPRIYKGDGSGNVYVKCVKFETGNKATDWTPAPEDIDNVMSSIKGELELKVGKTDYGQIISMINASADVITLTSNRFSLNSTYTKISTDGTCTFTGGTIGGFSFDGNGLFNVYGNVGCGMQKYTGGAAFWAGPSGIGNGGKNAEFRVLHDGTLYGKTSSFTIVNVTDTLFAKYITASNTITTNGAIKADGDITGRYITANSGITATAIESKTYKCGGGWLNLQTNNAVQARNYNDSGWVAMNASSFNNQSSRRYKTNIEDMTEKVAKQLLKYRPVSYDYINKIDGTNCLGMIAEEVAEINKYPVYYTPDGLIEGLDYSRFIPQCIKMIQIHQELIDNQKQEINGLKNIITHLIGISMNNKK